MKGCGDQLLGQAAVWRQFGSKQPGGTCVTARVGAGCSLNGGHGRSRGNSMSPCNLHP